MNNGVVIDPSRLKSIASVFSTNAVTLQSHLDRIISVNETIASSWISEQAKTYTNKITEQQGEIQKMIDTLNNLSGAMNQTAAGYEQIETDAGSAMS